MTSEADRQRLLRIARDAIVAHVSGVGTADEGSPSVDLAGHNGAFVTIHKHGELRGCIGRLDTIGSLPRVVRECAVAACSADPRFPPVAALELVALEIELSLLGPFEPIASADEVEVGRHGVAVEHLGQRGLLLPQVATEWRWDRQTFLTQTCRKAGLAGDAWQQGAKVWRFEAEVFGDNSLTTKDTKDTKER
jgi:AmmeMemoRadiSam system protein A